MKNYNISTYPLYKRSGLTVEGCDIAEDVYMRALCDVETLDEAYEEIPEALSDEMIYTYRQWQIMEEYQTPCEANYDLAYEKFESDLLACFYECVELEEE